MKSQCFTRGGSAQGTSQSLRMCSRKKEKKCHVEAAQDLGNGETPLKQKVHRARSSQRAEHARGPLWMHILFQERKDSTKHTDMLCSMLSGSPNTPPQIRTRKEALATQGFLKPCKSLCNGSPRKGPLGNGLGFRGALSSSSFQGVPQMKATVTQPSPPTNGPPFQVLSIVFNVVLNVVLNPATPLPTAFLLPNRLAPRSLLQCCWCSQQGADFGHVKWGARGVL